MLFPVAAKLRQNKFEIAMFPDHSFFAWSGHETMRRHELRLCLEWECKLHIYRHPDGQIHGEYIMKFFIAQWNRHGSVQDQFWNGGGGGGGG